MMIIILVASTWFSGCKKPPPAPLRLLSQLPQEIVQPRLKEFTDQYHLEVQLLSIDESKDVLHEFQKFSQQNKTPDLFMFKDEDLGRWLRLKKIRNLAPFHPNLTPFLQETITPFSHLNKIFALPMGWSTWVLYFNCDLFQKQILPEPRLTWDWGDLLIASEQLTHHNPTSSEIQQYGLVLTTKPENWLPFFWQLRGQLTSPSKIWTLTDPRYIQSHIEALGFLSDLFRIQQPPLRSEYDIATTPPPASSFQLDAQRLFIQGKAAMVIAPREFAYRLSQQSKMNWDVVPLPKSRASATLTQTLGVAMNSTCSQPEEAWKLLSFLCSETESAVLTQKGLILPARKNLLQSKLFLDFPGPISIQNDVFLSSLSTARSFPSIPLWSDAKRALQDEFLSFISNTNSSPRTTIETMQLRLEELSLLSTSQTPQRTRPTLAPLLR
jgi:ABC-type glycerol-3-phosphate transport system substrate-binding protein